MPEFEVNHLLKTETVVLRNVRCGGACRWTLADIAAEIRGSPVYLTQVFQHVESIPLYRYHLRLRLARAPDVFINARTDVYLRGMASGEAAVEEVIGRVARYRTAGCDGLFVPGLSEGKAIAALAAAIGPMPLNLMAVPGLPSIDVLQQLGVRRLSAGSAIAEAALGCTSRLTAGFLSGAVNELFTATAGYARMNALFGDGAQSP
jgi:AraC-like DNA-binding protein